MGIGLYINLPCGTLTVAIQIIFFHPPGRETTEGTVLTKLTKLDLLGFAIFVPSVVMLLLALQWGGSTYPWRSATTVGLFFTFSATIALFVVWQQHEKDRASIPPDGFLQRTVFCGAVVGFLSMGALQLITYYLPIWFQVIQAVDPTESGIRFFPTVLGNIVLSLMAGVLGTLHGTGWISYVC